MAESTVPDQDPPLVDVKITNPVTYFKKWWNKIIGNEGVEFRFHIKPLTAIIISVAVASVAFGVGRFVLPFNIPFFQTQVIGSPTPTPEVWKETAFNGTLRLSEATGKFYLITSSSPEAITLEVPENIDLTNYIGRRIFAAGKYNKSTRVLVVSDAADMEVLPKKAVSIPTLIPTPTPVLTPSPTPASTQSASPSAELKL